MAMTAQGDKRMMGMNGSGRWWNMLRLAGWSLAALILLAPLVAMLFTDEVNWGPVDFLFAALVLGGSGLLFELVLRRSSDSVYRTGMLLALAGAVLLIWSNAAVGFVGSGANTVNVLYFAMLAVPVVGGIVSAFKAKGMFLTMLLTAVVQAAITVFAFASGAVSEEEGRVIPSINAIFILIWMGSALLFHRSPEQGAPMTAGVQRNTLLRRSPVQFVLSLLLSSIGAVMLITMITVEREPGAVPLLVFILGSVWFLTRLYRSKASRNN